MSLVNYIIKIGCAFIRIHDAKFAQPMRQMLTKQHEKDKKVAS